MSYRINDVFHSLQGEGVWAGTPALFIRFQGCNLRCDEEPGPLSPGGFACDTEFRSGRDISSGELFDWLGKLLKGRRTPQLVVLTGGEPALQVDAGLVSMLKDTCGFSTVAIETNGTTKVCKDVDWVTLSPKVAEHALKQCHADEVKYVRAYGQGIPKVNIAQRTSSWGLKRWISPAFSADHLTQATLEWCIQLCMENPEWSLSMQQHKLWGVR